MAKFIQTGELDVVDSNQRTLFSDEVNAIRSKILSSSALTLTTNISDVSHLTETARRFALSEEGMQRMSIMGEADVSVSGIRRRVEGIIDYDSNSGEYRITSAGESYPINKNVAEKTILDTVSNMPGKVRDFGINYIQNSQIYEIDRLQKLGLKKADALEKSTILKSLGKTYETFGTSISLGSAIDIARGKTPKTSIFSVGAEAFPDIQEYNNAVEQLATSRAAMGNPYYMLDVNSIKASTILSESTGDYGRNILERLTSMVTSGKYAEGSTELEKLRKQIDTLKYVDYKDIIPEVGVSHFIGEQRFRVFKDDVIREKMFIPLDIMEKAAGTDLQEGRISLSYVQLEDNKTFMNAVFNIAEGGTSAQRQAKATSLAEAILKAAEEKVNATSFAKNMDDELAKSALMLVNRVSDASKRQVVIEQMANNILAKGVVIGSIEGEAAQRAFESLRLMGIDLSNDIAAGRLSARIIDILGEGYGLRLTPAIDDVVERATGLTPEMQSARGTVIEYLNKLAEFIQSEGIEDQARAKIRRSMLRNEAKLNA